MGANTSNYKTNVTDQKPSESLPFFRLAVARVATSASCLVLTFHRNVIVKSPVEMPSIRGCCKVSSQFEKYPNRFGPKAKVGDKVVVVKDDDEKSDLTSVERTQARKIRKLEAKVKRENSVNEENIEPTSMGIVEARIRKPKVFYGDLQSGIRASRSRRATRPRLAGKNLENDIGSCNEGTDEEYKASSDEFCHTNEHEILSLFFLVKNIQSSSSSESNETEETEGTDFNNQIIHKVEEEIALEKEKIEISLEGDQVLVVEYDQKVLDELEKNVICATEAIMALAALRNR